MRFFEKIKDRRIQIFIFFLIVFTGLVTRLAVLTITNGYSYREQSINKRLKRISLIAKRGEIFDRNGKLIAGNLSGFSVTISGSTVSPKQLNDVAIRLIDILDKYDQEHIGFPIKVQGDTYSYVYDENIENWLNDNGYVGYTNAEALFEEIRRREQVSVVLTDEEAQKILRLKGVYLPFSQKKMKFYSEIEKEDFLESYGLKKDTPAKEAFETIRKRREFSIPKELSGEEAYKILTIRHEFRVLAYRKYVPIHVAKDIDKNVAVKISEMSMELPGVSVEIYPKRYYPYGASAAHALGYMGKIAQQDEIDKYIKTHGYDRNQLIGKVGLEASYELDLKGSDGWKYIEIDALGKLVREVPEGELSWLEKGKRPKKTKSGKNIYSTIDIELQKKVENRLAYGLEVIQKGGVYESPWGDYKYKEAFPNAQTGAVLVVNVKNGQILAMANWPSYDVNLFATGIKAADWAKLQPKNPRNPLEPRPLYNLSALTAVQPGSTYKMVTGFAAILQGLDPTKKINADGKIDIGGHSFGCWLWNDYRGKHGYVDLYKALEVSCNYYFFDISTGYDWKNKKNLGFEMNTNLLLEHSKKLGLDEPSGVEIYESNPGIPDPDKKRRQLERALKTQMEKSINHYFPEKIGKDEAETEKIIEKIVSWSKENPPRNTIIKRLMKMGALNYSVAESLADVIKYDYFNQMEWFEGDTLNLSIGQGAHQYTPLQMARYIATVANDGYLNQLTLVRAIGTENHFKNQNVDNKELVFNNALSHLRKGMLQATQADLGTARLFKDFPIVVAAKTGTAEKEGLIPPADEEAYLKTHLKKIDSRLKWEAVENRAKEILILRNEEIASLEKEKRTAVSQEVIDKKEKKLKRLIRKGYLDYSSALRQAIKDKSSLPLDDENINAYREEYDSYAWFVSFGPYDSPEIAVVAMIPQGGHGGYAAPIVRDIYGDCFHLIPPQTEEDGTESE